MSQPNRVSVIMIFLNEERFIQEAIDSVWAQTYKNWELLLVDDGSTDDSTSIARQYALRFPGKVRYVEHAGHANRGMSASRNLGISHASGEYLAFLDADDVWFPPKLEEQVALLDAHPGASVLYGATERWYNWTGKPEDSPLDEIKGLGLPVDRVYQPPALLPLFLKREVTLPCTCSLLVRRKLIERIGGFEESFPGIYEDQVFYTKAALHASIYVAGACWDRYRKHSESCCATVQATGRESSARLHYLQWVGQYLSAQGIADPAPWEALQQEVRRVHAQRLQRLYERALSGIRQISKLSESNPG